MKFELLGYQWLMVIVLLITVTSLMLSQKYGLCWFKIPLGSCFILYFWLIFNFIICFWELIIIENKEKLHLPEKNFYLESYSWKDLLSSKFWVEGWNRYLMADPRYGDPKDSVFRYELFNVLSSLIPSAYLMYQLTTRNAQVKEKDLFRFFFFYSLLQVAGVFFYFESYFQKYGLKYIAWDKKEEVIYLGLSLLWFLFPVYLISVSMQ